LVVVAALIALTWSAGKEPLPSPGSGLRERPSEEASSQKASQAPSEARHEPEDDPGHFHIALVTGDAFMGADVAAGAKEVAERYGRAESGGLIRHLALGRELIESPAALSEAVASFADEPMTKVLVIGEGLGGTTEAVSRIRQRRPDMLILVGESHEDIAELAGLADLVVMADFIARGYLIPWSARKLGVQTMVHVSFPRHLAVEALARQLKVMEAASGDLGLALVEVEGPDPLAGASAEEIAGFYDRNVPTWLDLYGPQTAFFSTNNGHAAAIIRSVVKYGGYFVEAQDSSPLIGYPEAFDLDLDNLAGDWPRLIGEVEGKVIAASAEGRLGTWTSSLSYSHVTGLVEFGRLVASGEAKIGDLKALLRCYDKFTSGVVWNGAPLLDDGGRAVAGAALVYQDTYVFGRGYLGTTASPVPEAYRAPAAPIVAAGAEPWHVAVVTGEFLKDVEYLAGTQELVKRYGHADEGGLIRPVPYPESHLDNPVAMARLIEDLAKDEALKVIVVNQAVPGTAEGFRRVKAVRPDVLCLAGEPHESPALLARRADLVVAGDHVARGYLIPWAAKRLGADKLVHVSFDRHLGYQIIRLRRQIMEEAAADLGLEFEDETAADPVDPPGIDGAKESVKALFPGWVRRYGPNAAFFSTNDIHADALIGQIAGRRQGFMPEADIPSTLVGYPGALDLDLRPLLGQWDQIIRTIEEAVVQKGASGRLGAWPYPLGFAETAGLAEYGIRLVEDRAKPQSLADILQCLRLYSPGVNWNASLLSDPVTGALLRNYVMVYQDTFVFGLGNLNTTEVEIPLKYYSVTLEEAAPGAN
jgi:hypothetical protein